jgi:DNA-binding transcriptional LysR family regulator
VLDRETMRYRTLQTEPLVLAAPEGHPLARLPVVPVERLAGQPHLLLPPHVEPLRFRGRVTDVLGRSRVSPSVLLEATSLESACSAVAAGLGVAFLAESLTRVLAVPGVVHRPFAPPAPLSKLGVAWRQDTTSTTVRWFLEVLDELTAAGRTDRPLARVASAGMAT